MGVVAFDCIIEFENEAISLWNEVPWTVNLDDAFVVPMPTFPNKILGVRVFVWFIEFEKLT